MPAYTAVHQREPHARRAARVRLVRPAHAASGFLTVGTPDANGAQANSTGFVSLNTIAGDSGTPADEADLRLTTHDHRRAQPDRPRRLLGPAPGPAARSGITDLDNPPPAGGLGRGTVAGRTFAFTVPCTTTADTAVGSTCSVSTTANAVTPGAIKESKRTIWELGQIDVLDGGPDGQVCHERQHGVRAAGRFRA